MYIDPGYNLILPDVFPFDWQLYFIRDSNFQTRRDANGNQLPIQRTVKLLIRFRYILYCVLFHIAQRSSFPVIVE